MKSINTLVEDIRSVLVSHKLNKDAVTAFGHALAGKLVDRLCEGDNRSELRMSNFGMPDRKLWYTVNKPELAEPLSAEVRLKFLYGDIIEELMIFLAKQAGHDVKHEQREVELNGIHGHIDAVVDGVVVDFKSAGSRSFSKFAEHRLDYDDPFHYRDQLSLYVQACRDLPDVTVKRQGSFLAVDKELGRFCLDTYTVKDIDYEQESVRKNRMLREDQPPSRCYSPVPHGASGNQRLSVECSYCPFKRDCWKDTNQGRGLRTFLYSTGVVHLTHVAREPDVPEIT